jgi:hypothetical protein
MHKLPRGASHRDVHLPCRLSTRLAHRANTLCGFSPANEYLEASERLPPFGGVTNPRDHNALRAGARNPDTRTYAIQPGGASYLPGRQDDVHSRVRLRGYGEDGVLKLREGTQPTKEFRERKECGKWTAQMQLRFSPPWHSRSSPDCILQRTFIATLSRVRDTSGLRRGPGPPVPCQ